MNYVSSKEARDYLHVSAVTLRNWVKMGRMKSKRISNRKFLYDIDSYDPETASLSKEDKDDRKSVIYARVSTYSQTKDLTEQIETIKKYCLCHGVVIQDIYKDISSGMNENRSGLNSLITEILDGNIKTVYISFKDRLARFGFDYFVNLFKRFNTEIVILDSNEQTSKTFQQELTDDLIAIIHHFSMKIHSNKRKKLQEIKKMLEQENNVNSEEKILE